MSVEFKCDRCGEPIPPGDVSRTSGNFTIWRDGKDSTFDLCKDCLDKMDIFMSGKMPKPTVHDELSYFEVSNPNVWVHEKKPGTGLERGPEIHISAELEPLSKQIEGYLGTYIPLSSVEQVILGVALR